MSRNEIQPLPLYKVASLCVGSGFCCKQRPCSFGESISAENLSCKHLKAIENKNGQHQRYTCGIYSEIIGKPGWEVSPAFGAGCCSSLFNPDRAAIIAELRSIARSGKDITEYATLHHFDDN